VSCRRLEQVGGSDADLFEFSEETWNAPLKKRVEMRHDSFSGLLVTCNHHHPVRSVKNRIMRRGRVFSCSIRDLISGSALFYDGLEEASFWN
jgi:hypothetical protein